MDIFNDYLATIEAAMAASKKSPLNFINESRSYGIGGSDLSKAMSFSDVKKQASEEKLLPSLNNLAEVIGVPIRYEQQLGHHPDFCHLKGTDMTENHSIVTMFIDINRSTSLFRKYEPEVVWVITNTIQKAAIHTCLIFGGYVHRLHGDGLFVYFGGRNSSAQDAVTRSLRSASVFSYFVKNDLKELFSEQGVEKIFTRIGIDFGYDADVVWGMAGMGNISEITTCSLHTNLAAHMQGFAENNGVVVGGNVKTEFRGSDDLFDSVALRTNKTSDRYIFSAPEDNFNYSQYDFSWLKFLKRQDFIATTLADKLILKQKWASSTEGLERIARMNQPYSRFKL